MLLSGATTADVPLAALSLPPPKAVVWADVRETPARDDLRARRQNGHGRALWQSKRGRVATRGSASPSSSRASAVGASTQTPLCVVIPTARRSRPTSSSPATGLSLLATGGMGLVVDERPVDPAQTVAYKGIMLERDTDVALAIGYATPRGR
jgi:hypothetical protein